jgi:pimeloyl-ACP methyl ester carboxylesterase
MGGFVTAARLDRVFIHNPTMTRMVLLPGLGADARLFRDQADLAADITIPAWPPRDQGESLVQFARRIADTLTQDVDVVGGASFGGMVALEIAALIRPRAVALIGSCTSPEAVAPWLRATGHVFVKMPVAAFRPRRLTSPIVRPLLGPLRPAEEQLFWSMASATSPAFLRWGCRAILGWRPTSVSTSVFHLHGSRDRLIPLGRVRPTRILEGAAHLPSLSHPAETKAFLRDVLNHLA